MAHGREHRGPACGIAVALAALLSSDERLAALGAGGARYARERLTWDQIARRFEEMYREMLGQSSGRVRHRYSAAG
jgi:glycosyltransferase involved in cell wall biosynthesis